MSIASKNRDYLSSFGRNRGRTLRPYPQQLVDHLLPQLSPPHAVTDEEAATQLKHWCAALMAEAKGQGYRQITLEIGFGGGEHLLMQAAYHPDTLFIGCEPFINGVAKCLAGIDAQKLTNIRLFTRDARELLLALPPHSLDTAFILFPDPWPKLRHNKRRLVNADTLSMLARAQKPGGRLLIATDHVDYSVWILEHLLAHLDYTWTAEAQADWLTPPAEWTETKYQRKTSAEGRAPLFFACVRN